MNLVKPTKKTDQYSKVILLTDDILSGTFVECTGDYIKCPGSYKVCTGDYQNC